MKKFFQRILRFIAFPVLVMSITLIPYVIADPYMDFGKYENYSWKYNFQILGDLSTKKLLNTEYQYNSYIFGSSRSISLYACYLNQVIPNASFYHYANWAEAIADLHAKLAFLDEYEYTIDNAIIYLDADITFRGDGTISDLGHYLHNNKSRNTYLTDHFIRYYKNFSVDKAKILMGLEVKGDIFPNWNSDPVTNDTKQQCTDLLLSEYASVDRSDSLITAIDSLKETGFYYERPQKQQYYDDQISKAEKEILIRIKELFAKHATNYYVIITPLYDQTKFSIEDQAILNEIFGDRLYDFSGINDYTNNAYDFPDRIHFQPYISKLMIDSILQPRTEGLFQ